MLISDRIFEIIKERNMTQKAFSERTGIPQTTISDWKGKRLNPSSDKIMVICDALDVTPYELLGGIETKGGKRTLMTLESGSEEYMLVETFRSMPEEQKKRLMSYIEVIGGTKEN